MLTTSRRPPVGFQQYARDSCMLFLWLFHVAELIVFIYIHGPAIVLQSTRPKSQKANWKRLNVRTVPFAFHGEIGEAKQR